MKTKPSNFDLLTLLKTIKKKHKHTNKFYSKHTETLKIRLYIIKFSGNNFSTFQSHLNKKSKPYFFSLNNLLNWNRRWKIWQEHAWNFRNQYIINQRSPHRIPWKDKNELLVEISTPLPIYIEYFIHTKHIHIVKNEKNGN